MSETSAALPLTVIHRGWNTFGIASASLADGSAVPPAQVDRGEAARILRSERRAALRVRQARGGPAFWGQPTEFDEAPGGGPDGGQPAATAIREAVEGAGGRLRWRDSVDHAYSVPIVPSEPSWLDPGTDCQTGRVAPGGPHGEAEQVPSLELPPADPAEAACSVRLSGLKTLVLVQALMLRKSEFAA